MLFSSEFQDETHKIIQYGISFEKKPYKKLIFFEVFDIIIKFNANI